jgi:Protein of unknown function (DUF3455)
MKNYVTRLVVTFAIALPHAAHADHVTRPIVPAAIEVPAGHRPFLMGHAAGTQNYICTATPTGLKWLFIGPQATLFDADSQQIITHFQSKNPYKSDAIQATWQHSRNTSVVWATRLTGSIDPGYVSPDAIEWLLLGVTGASVGPSGGDKLVPAAFIQRVNTVGGKEPATACTESTLNQRQLVSYEADYFFYR